MYNLSTKFKKVVEYSLLTILICVILFFVREEGCISYENFSLAWIFAQVITITLGCSLMLITLGSVKIKRYNYFYFWAIVIGIIGIIDLSRVLVYTWTRLFTNDYNMLFQLCILGRSYECIMINLANRYINKKFNFYKVFTVNFFIIGLFLVDIIVFKFFPACYVEGYGLTVFIKIIEFMIALGYVRVLVLVIKSKQPIIIENKRDIEKIICLEILTSIAFSLNTNTYSLIIFFGYVFSLLYYYFAFKLILKYIMLNPYHKVVRDLNDKVSELEKTNNELLNTRSKMQNIEDLHKRFINFIPDGVIIARNRKIEYVNNRLISMLQIKDKNEILNMDVIELLDTKDYEIFKARFENSNKHILEIPQQYEFIFKEKRKWVEITSLTLNDEEGEYIISTIRDIQDRKKAEETERLLELKKSEESMKNEFFANISHELKTPINVIYSALQVEEQALKNGADNENFVKYNNIIRQNCLRLIRLVNNIIDTTRIETGFFKPTYTIENIVAVAEDTTMSIVEYIESRDMTLIFDTELEEAYVNCDTDLIERIILNLLANSVKHGKEKGFIKVYIYQDDPNNVKISIKDDGVGIPREMMGKIFNRFIKIDNSLSRKAEGSGIGLSLVKQLIEIHNGTIDIDSELNIGTECTLTFPIVQVDAEVAITKENRINFEKHIIKPAEIEFSDIY